MKSKDYKILRKEKMKEKIDYKRFYHAIKSVMRANGKSSVVTSDEINEVINEFEDLEEKG